MKKLFYIIIVILITNSVKAQEGKVSIDQDPQISQLLELYKKSLDKNDYYKIQVGFVSNNEKAQEIKSNVEIDFPELPSQIDFDSPTYRIRVGRFKSKLEAERKFNEVRKKYPNAMLLKPKKSTL
ncbi:SPOR domain-containing protein [Maribacter sp. PR1]|uniref:SPOR domain-containing protein n=1 Tax=Maribacter cobaltidurans TaxID=1178778 RepID=A0ABU7IP43_9FLAO|nr:MULTISPECIES: SPOR domain-containing protein [Maribacter]MDC6387352.1 SPOR domain-containing protein [Maribacter sp. PR1]MEE1974737.1 SPOR domain-containing protein [Maribacter cobaltidurans]